MTKWGLLGAAALVVAGCGSGGGTSASGGAKKRVGFVQFTTTSSLDDGREGFVEGLEEMGFRKGENLEIDFQNAQGDAGNASMMLQKYEQDGVDLVGTAGTQAAQAAKRAVKGRPVVFCAVVSAVAAGVGDAEGHGKGQMTGLINPFPIDKGVALVKEVMPMAKKIGTLYDPGEPFSEAQLKAGHDASAANGAEWIAVPVSRSNDIASGVQALKARGVEAILQLPSNTINQGLEGQVKEALKQRIPIFSVQTDQVAKGVIAAIGVDIHEAGREAGKIAGEILKGKKATEILIRPATKQPLKASEANAAKFGVTLPASVLERAEKG
jgi:putative ABC transport system substrate-binding protein